MNKLSFKNFNINLLGSSLNLNGFMLPSKLNKILTKSIPMRSLNNTNKIYQTHYEFLVLYAKLLEVKPETSTNTNTYDKSCASENGLIFINFKVAV